MHISVSSLMRCSVVSALHLGWRGVIFLPSRHVVTRRSHSVADLDLDPDAHVDRTVRFESIPEALRLSEEVKEHCLRRSDLWVADRGFGWQARKRSLHTRSLARNTMRTLANGQIARSRGARARLLTEPRAKDVSPCGSTSVDDNGAWVLTARHAA